MKKPNNMNKKNRVISSKIESYTYSDNGITKRLIEKYIRSNISKMIDSDTTSTRVKRAA